MKIIVFFQILIFFPTVIFSQWQIIMERNYSLTSFKDIYFVDSSFGCTISEDEILVTTDGGVTWKSRIPYQGYQDYNYYSVFFITHRIGWIGGIKGVILKTTNSGDTWSRLSQNNISTKWNDIFALDTENVWIVGDNGKILHTQNGGTSWDEINLDISNDLSCIQFIENGFGWIGGDGIILKTEDGGKNWSMNISERFGNTTKIFFLNKDKGFLVGPLSDDPIKTLWSSNDGGAHWDGIWTNDLPGSIYNLIDVYFFDRLHGYALSGTAQGSLIIKTDDGGYSWKIDYNSSTIDLWDFTFSDKNNGWACGEGLILHGKLDVPVSVYENKKKDFPSKFLLYQNFPNPFNPTTKINYSIPRRNNVVIKVYDLLGKELTTLVNEEKTPGDYEVTWSASNLPNGVYFYRMQAGSFVETKKMFLVK